MIKKEVIAKLSALAKVKVEDLTAALEGTEEKDIEISDKVISFTDDEVTTLKNNEYKKGKSDGIEIEVKKFKEEKGLDFQGKTLEGLAEALTKKTLADAKIEPNKQIEELNTKLTNLQKTVQEKERLLEQKEGEVTRVKTNNELYKVVPQVEGLDPDDVVGLMERKGYEFKMDNGKVVVHKDGNLLIDKLSNAIAPKDAISEFVKEKGFGIKAGDGKTPGGRGGGDGISGGKPTKVSELKKKFESEGKSLIGEEFQAAVKAAIADNADFDLNS